MSHSCYPTDGWKRVPPQSFFQHLEKYWDY